MYKPLRKKRMCLEINSALTHFLVTYENSTYFFQYLYYFIRNIVFKNTTTLKYIKWNQRIKHDKHKIVPKKNSKTNTYTINKPVIHLLYLVLWEENSLDLFFNTGKSWRWLVACLFLPRPRKENSAYTTSATMAHSGKKKYNEFSLTRPIIHNE